MAQQDTNLYTAVARLSERVRNLENLEQFTGHDVIAPNYAAPIGTTHWDSNLRRFWVNYNGTAGGWQLVGGGGSVTGSGTPPEFAYWTGANAIGSATDIEFLAGGGIDFQAGGAYPANARIQSLDNVADSLRFVDSGGAEYIRIVSTNTQPEIVINDNSTDIDFRVETDTETHTIFVRGNDGVIGIGLAAPNSKIEINGDVRISGANDRRLYLTPGVTGVATQASFAAITGGHIDIKNNGGVQIHRIDQTGIVYIGKVTPDATGASGSIVVTNEHSGAEPFVDTLITLDRFTTGTPTAGSGCRIRYKSEDSSGLSNECANTVAYWSNAVTANRSGDYSVTVASNTAIIEMMSLDGLNTQPEISFNDSANDVDFRVESNTVTHALFIQGSDGYTGIGESTPTYKLHTSITSGLTSTRQNMVRYDHSTTGVAANGFGSTESWYLEDSGGTLRWSMRKLIEWSNATTANRSSKFAIQVLSNVNLRELLTLNGLNTQPEVVINDDSIDCDFRVESDVDTHGIFMRGDNGYLGIGAASPDQMVEFEEEEGLTGNISDGYSAALRLDPAYQADSVYTVTRHNYIEMQNVQLIDSAAITNAAAIRFDAGIGTHYALASAFTTTDSNADTTNWAGGVIININGTLYKIPFVAV